MTSNQIIQLGVFFKNKYLGILAPTATHSSSFDSATGLYSRRGWDISRKADCD